MTVDVNTVVPAWMTAEEWEIRCDLAALYRLVAHFGWSDLIYTHISARLPGPEHRFLINGYGLLFNEMTASDLVRVDHDGNIVEPDDGRSRRVNPAGFVIHSAIHMARPDLMCVVHTHTPAGIAVSSQRQGLLPMAQQALKFYERLAYHSYEGIATDLEERKRLVQDLGTHKAMILRNHGLLAAGGSIGEALHGIYYLERACLAQVHALAGGSELVMPEKTVCEHAARQFDALSQAHYEMFFRSATRLLAGDWRA